MYSKKSKGLWYRYLFFLFVIFIAISGFFFYNYWRNQNNFTKTYFQVIDMYSTQYFTMEELDTIYGASNFSENLKWFSEKLYENLSYQFIEFKASPIELIGYWDKPLYLANGYGHKDLTNQAIIHEGRQIEITPVNAVQLGRDSQLFLFQKEIFQESDFKQQDNKISLILGSDFKDYYKIGDEIEFIYLYKTWCGTVKGFLEEGTQIQLDDFLIYQLDNFMIMPFFESLSTDTSLYFDDTFQIDYYLQKTNGYLKLEKKEEYKKAKAFIENLAAECGLKYTVLRGD